MFKKYCCRIFTLIVIFLSLNATLSAQGIMAGVPTLKLDPIEQSTAYQQFSRRPVSDLSKLLYLIDRFSVTDIQIVYDNYQYNAKFSAAIARWFLGQRYHKESAEYWILNWCNNSFPGNNLIWIKLPDGKYRLARELLMDELKNLNKAIADGVKPAPANVPSKPSQT